MKKLRKKADLKQTIQSYKFNCYCACGHCPSIPTHAVGEEGVRDGNTINEINNT